MATRREFLLHGAIGVGVISGAMSGIEALAKDAVPQRVSLRGLAWNDPIVATYRDAVGIMKQRPDGDKLSWVGLSSIHGTDPNTYHFCPHGDWYFLPWHRAFTTMYERMVRSLTRNDGFAMPYWDWTADPMMPEVFLDPKTPDGKVNWLCVTDAGWERTWDRKTPMPAEIVGPKVLGRILAATGFENFGTSRNKAQDSADPSWVPRGGGSQGILEATPHNLVHNNIGGWMPSASSSRDPLFFMHHANIDRIWARWNTANPNPVDPLWTGMKFVDNFLNPDGSFWSPKVSELYDPETLGYTYNLAVRARPASTKVVALDHKLSAMFALPDLAGPRPAGVQTVVVANDRPAKAGLPLDVAITVPGVALRGVRTRAPLKSTADLTDFVAVQESGASGVRALAFLRDVVISDPHATMFRVFVDSPDLTDATPITDPHYVGTFGVFHAGGGRMGHGNLPSFVIDLTEALQRTHSKDATRIHVQLVAVTSVGSAGATGTATPGAVEISLVRN